jgi:hypothetical protein
MSRKLAKIFYDFQDQSTPYTDVIRYHDCGSNRHTTTMHYGLSMKFNGWERPLLFTTSPSKQHNTIIINSSLWKESLVSDGQHFYH